MNVSNMLSTDEAAVALGLEESHVRRLCRDKKIVAVKKGRDWLITPNAVEAYRNADRKRGPKPKKEGN